MTKFRRQFQKNQRGAIGEINEGVSQTVPDQTISLKQLLVNHTRGIPSNAPHIEGHYTGVEIPVINDLNDLQEIRDALADREKQLNEKMFVEKEARKQKAAEKAKLKAQKESEQKDEVQSEKDK